MLTKKAKWLLAFGWFVALIAFDILFHPSRFAGKDIAVVLGELTSFMSIPGVWLLSLIVLLVIALAGRKRKTRGK